mmetsp:Transcript_67505/g.113088  ORF Transcript_67505/g.113088 Transcript_67505/m.113088 type:complete len:81 (-) Transcript_67505:207-449(-)
MALREAPVGQGTTGSLGLRQGQARSAEGNRGAGLRFMPVRPSRAPRGSTPSAICKNSVQLRRKGEEKDFFQSCSWTTWSV